MRRQVKCKNKSVDLISSLKQLIPSPSSILDGQMQHISPSRTATKPHREKEPAPVPTDIAEKMIALKRKQAKYVFNPLQPPPPPPVSIFLLIFFVRIFSHVRVKDRTERPLVPVPAPSPPSPPRRPQPSSGQSPPVVLINRPVPDPSEFSWILKLSPTQKPPPHVSVDKRASYLILIQTQS